MRPLSSHLLRLAFPCCFLLASLLFAEQGASDHSSTNYRHHDDPQWESVSKHLPDPATASPSILEGQADLLRVRRFPEDALDFYKFALERGGNRNVLLNKIGLTELELRNAGLAEQYFRQAIKADRRGAPGWNNLAAVEYLQKRYLAAVSDYKHAVKLKKKDAVLHANLSSAYFELHDYKHARREAALAIKLDSNVFQNSGGLGIAAHVLSIEDRARYSFEMARLYAENGQMDEMLHMLSKSSEDGFDILGQMAKDSVLSKYRTDPRVVLIAENTKALFQKAAPTVAASIPAVPTTKGRE